MTVRFRPLRPLAVALLLLSVAPVMAQVDTGVIDLGGPAESSPGTADDAAASPVAAPGDLGGRRAFDHDLFRQRLESSWFRRRALLAEGRFEDAARQGELIRSFCREEGIGRLEPLAGAVLLEVERYLEEGRHEQALAAVDFAAGFDPGRAEIHVARATVLWKAGNGVVPALREFVRGARAALLASWTTLAGIHALALSLLIALLAGVLVFSALMAIAYHAPFRHEVEEWMTRRGLEGWGPLAGWMLFLLPLWTWFFAAWVALYWIAITVRFMRRGERLAAITLLLALATAVPLYRASVSVYGMMSDPAVRNTLGSARGDYSPDRIVALRELVDRHPEDPVFRFLLAGLYRNGGYLEEAYEEYLRVLDLEPGDHQAHINIGNIFFRIGQYGEAVRHYRNATELEPRSVLAAYNTYLAQSESFKFKEAEQNLRQAQSIDPELTARLMERSQVDDQRAMVVDAQTELGSVWIAAVEGRTPRQALAGLGGGGSWNALGRQLVNPLSLVALGTIALAIVLFSIGRARPARRCIRCGRAFCNRCHSAREGKEYCTQCLHLFVLGEGLAPETKTRKLFEVERFALAVRRLRTAASLLFPGAAHVLRGRAIPGLLLIVGWFLLLLLWHPALMAPVEAAAGMDVRLEALRVGPVPDLFVIHPAGILALTAALLVWLAGNLWIWRRREV